MAGVDHGSSVHRAGSRSKANTTNPLTVELFVVDIDNCSVEALMNLTATESWTSASAATSPNSRMKLLTRVFGYFLYPSKFAISTFSDSLYLTPGPTG